MGTPGCFFSRFVEGSEIEVRESERENVPKYDIFVKGPPLNGGFLGMLRFLGKWDLSSGTKYEQSHFSLFIDGIQCLYHATQWIIVFDWGG